MKSIYHELIPNLILFSLLDIEKLGIIKVSMMKKLISAGKIQIVKIGNKIHVTRSEIISYLEKNTIPKSYLLGVNKAKN